MYVPGRCKKTNCALLLAPHYNVTKFVIQHIDEMELYVKVVWLGSNLKQVVDKLVNKYNKPSLSQSIIILGWTPSAFINPENNFIRVAFKRCELLNSSHSVGCKYEMNRLIKTSWSKLEQIAKPAYEALYRITFSQENYNDLLHQYNLMSSNQTIYDVACSWMLENEKTWLKWIPGKDFILWLFHYYRIKLLLFIFNFVTIKSKIYFYTIEISLTKPTIKLSLMSLKIVTNFGFSKFKTQVTN